MQLIQVVALCALVLASGLLSSVDCYITEINEEYLDIEDGLRQLMPSGDEDVLEHITKNKLKSSEPTEMVSEFTEIIKGLPDTMERDFFQYLVDMSNPTGDCDSIMLRYAYAIISLAKLTNEPAVKSYLGYLKFFGKTKFGGCAQQIKWQFEVANAKLGHTEEALDHFFKVFKVYEDGRVNDETLAEVAKRIDLTRVTYKNLRELVKVTTVDRPGKYTMKPTKMISHFIETRCDDLQEHFKVMFGIYNLAIALGAQVESSVPAKFHKLNEYNRVCYSWQKNPEEALANLKGQLENGNVVQKVFAGVADAWRHTL